MIERARSQWVRRALRNAANTTGIAYRSDGSWLRVQMTNVSYDGCHILTEDRLDVGETLTVVVPRMQQLSAQVRWVTGNAAGIRFLHNASAAEARRARLGV